MIAAPSRLAGCAVRHRRRCRRRQGYRCTGRFRRHRGFGDAAKAIAATLVVEHAADLPGAVLLGNAAAQHPQASKLHAAAQWIAEQTGAKFGYFVDAANTVGGYLVNATSKNAANLFAQPKKAYVLLNAEPELDAANPQQAIKALQGAEMVVAMSAFKHGMDYADVLLPISPFSETAGTFVNCEGRAQSFNGTVKPLGETRPAWKVLRVLGNLLGLSGFDYENSEAIRDEALGKGNTDLSAKLSNVAKLAPTAAKFGNGEQAGTPDRPADLLRRRHRAPFGTAAAHRRFAGAAGHHLGQARRGAGREGRRPWSPCSKGRAARPWSPPSMRACRRTSCAWPPVTS
jgi:NADH-quinone oxidoreductase subunit G